MQDYLKPIVSELFEQNIYKGFEKTHVTKKITVNSQWSVDTNPYKCYALEPGIMIQTFTVFKHNSYTLRELYEVFLNRNETVS